MSILLVGNGFDLHHYFPTSYINFLHTIQFMIDNYEETMTTVGGILNNKVLHETDPFLKECSEKHYDIFDNTPLPASSVSWMIEKAKNNMWFNYLSNSINKDIKWIDFEKEIGRVLKAFSSFLFSAEELYLSNDSVYFNYENFLKNMEDQHILEKFKFFFDFQQNLPGIPSRTAVIKKQYVIEKVTGSKVYYTDDDLIVSELYKSLGELSEILRYYFSVFVDAPMETMRSYGYKPRWPGVITTSRVYSFNYTNTFETLYGNNMVEHIHGSTLERIVLGVNPDENDELEDIDTTFLQFKKYFQRIFYKTDTSYLKNITAMRAIPRSSEIELVVIGHSLDITDKDIITQVFELASKITIMYHKESSVKKLINNLVNIYGKRGLDTLREKKKLQFILQDTIEWVKVNGVE